MTTKSLVKSKMGLQRASFIILYSTVGGVVLDEKKEMDR